VSSATEQNGSDNPMVGQTSVVDPHHIDADPDSTYHHDADPNSDFNLMWIRMRIHIRIFI
jgi:hypothetical protein